MEPECSLIDLFTKETFERLEPPEDAESYAVFRIRNFSESGIHAFLRLVPALGVAMARSHVPLAQVQSLADLVTSILADGRLDSRDLFALLTIFNKLSR